MSEIERLEQTVSEKQDDLNSKKATSDAFPALNETYNKAVSIIENYDKTLFDNPNPDDVFDYLDYISNSDTLTKVYFDFNFTDSTAQDQYGMMYADISGYSKFVNVLNFINKLENSRLLNKVTQLSLVPATGGAEELDEITFTFTLESYYERVPIQENPRVTNSLVLNEEISTYNPFYPLIQPTVPPNTENLINIEQSRIIGLTGTRIFIVDQNGNITSLSEGDQVYLGELESIDLESKSATFNLNKGGITESVTLELER
ncbi:hypothetical protein [Gracilimonas sp.]|uniref:hypothetical protein n=1 Tax=Gracilimonas sp. TaxID=1974203 RepID=UPI002870D989|nr:hypothetical protein [Gracilimonas sp.]